MDAKISGEFWSDPAIEGLTVDQRLAALWAITSSRTTLVGYVEVSKKRFEFETGCPYDALLTLCDAHSKGFKKCGDGIWIRRFIAHQIGTGDSLVKNRMSAPLIRELRAWHGHDLIKYALTEYPELAAKYADAEEASPQPQFDAHAMGQSRAEGSREEQRGVEKPVKKPELIDSLLNRAKALLRIRSSTLLDSGQSTAWEKNKAAVASSTPEDWAALEWWFTQPSETGYPAEYRRTTLGALLNHWSDEVVKARSAARTLKVAFGAEKKERAAEIPDDWSGILTELDPEFNAPNHFQQLPESLRDLVLEEYRKRKKEAGDGTDNAAPEDPQTLL